MALFERRSKRVLPATPLTDAAAAAPERAGTSFAGIAVSSLERRDFTPYDFQTDEGVWVRLHDMQFMGFDYQVRTAALTLRFVYDNPEWTPPEARATPVAVFRFSDVVMHAWEDDEDLLGTPVEVRGQVRDLDYWPSTNEFSLDTVNTRLRFSARSLDVQLEPMQDG